MLLPPPRNHQGSRKTLRARYDIERGRKRRVQLRPLFKESPIVGDEVTAPCFGGLGEIRSVSRMGTDGGVWSGASPPTASEDAGNLPVRTGCSGFDLGEGHSGITAR